MADPTPTDRSALQPVPLASPGDRGWLAARLPTPLTSFVGRTHEVEQACGLLRRDGVRLLTLTGPGGVGKTRLAIGVAEALAAEFCDGVAFVPLASIAEPGLVGASIAQALGIRETGDRPSAAALAAALSDNRLLLVLDNFEQIVQAAPLIVDLLVACPHLKVLVSSRTPLRASGEYTLPVPPLDFPDPAAPLEHLAMADAARLFAERARAADPSFALTTENAAAVAGICARLDGLPLALELAAAKARLLPPAALVARLDRRLPLLTGGARDQPARLRTMRDAIAWSHELLAPGEQTLFRRLAVFVDGFTLDAAEAVAAERAELSVLRAETSSAQHSEPSTLWVTHHSVLDGIEALAEQSLIRRLDPVASEPRFAMLETVREFAFERLAGSGEAEELRRRHAA